MLIPLDNHIASLTDIPYTISYVIRKRLQIDNLNELPEDKRPTDYIMWHSNPDILENWLDKVMDRKGKKQDDENAVLEVDTFEIEG